MPGDRGLVSECHRHLKQRVRELTAGNRILGERLTAARSNLRFHDKRIADLEAQIADQVCCPEAKSPISELPCCSYAEPGRAGRDAVAGPAVAALAGRA